MKLPLEQNAHLIVDTDLNLTDSLSVQDSTLVLNGNISATSLRFYNSQIEREATDSFTVQQASFTDQSYEYKDDLVTTAMHASNSSIAVNRSLNLVSLDLHNTDLTINEPSSIDEVESRGGTIAINHDFSSEILADGTNFVMNSGKLSGSISEGSSSYSSNTTPIQFTRNGGLFNLDSLQVFRVSSLTLGLGDRISNLDIGYNDSELIINAELDFDEVTADTLTLNASISANSLSVRGLIERSDNSKITADSLRVQNYEFDGTDRIYQSLSGHNIDVAAPLVLSTDLSGSDLTIDAPTTAPAMIFTGELNINSELQISQLSGTDGVINLNHDLSALTRLSHSQINLNEGTLFGSLRVDNFAPDLLPPSAVNHLGGNFSLTNLTVEMGALINILGIDNVQESVLVQSDGTVVSYRPLDLYQVGIYDAQFDYHQALGETTGIEVDLLTIAEGGNLRLLFDEQQTTGLDWGMRIAGDQTMQMQSWIDQGNITWEANQEIGFFYLPEQFGDYTYVGSFTAVPEPTSTTILALAGLTIISTRRQRNASAQTV